MSSTTLHEGSGLQSCCPMVRANNESHALGCFFGADWVGDSGHTVVECLGFKALFELAAASKV